MTGSIHDGATGLAGSEEGGVAAGRAMRLRRWGTALALALLAQGGCGNDMTKHYGCALDAALDSSSAEQASALLVIGEPPPDQPGLTVSASSATTFRVAFTFADLGQFRAALFAQGGFSKVMVGCTSGSCEGVRQANSGDRMDLVGCRGSDAKAWVDFTLQDSALRLDLRTEEIPVASLVHYRGRVRTDAGMPQVVPRTAITLPIELVAVP